MSASEPWWGDIAFNLLQRRSWAFGERKVFIQRLPHEWNIWNIGTETEIETEGLSTLICGESDVQEQLDDARLSRYLQASTTDHIRVLPALADRSIVARPSVPLRLLGGEHARIYVSTPLWFRAFALPTQLSLLDVPFWPPSDSWFGPSTREGEMCYAKYTDARLQLNLLAQRPHRAITPISIHNKQQETLLIERLNVPVPLLSLYKHSERGLWTEAVTVTREENDDRVELHLEKEAPSEVPGAHLVAGPRIASEQGTLVRSLSSLFA